MYERNSGCPSRGVDVNSGWNCTPTNHGCASGPLRGLMDRVQVGGYGSVRYEGSSLEEQRHTFTFRRFVLTTDANIAPRLRAYMELEFERFRKLELEKTTNRSDSGGLEVEQTVEGTSDSEIAFEQAWMQYETSDKHAEVKVALDVLKDNEELGVTAMPLSSQDEKTQRQRLQQIGRVCAAVKTAQFLLDYNLAVPSTMHRWLVTAARRANKASAAKAQAMVVPIATSMAAVTPAAFVGTASVSV